MSTPRRPITLRLTVRHAEMVVAVLRRERRRKLRDHEKSGFVPAPGKFDANLMRVIAFDGIIGELDDQLNQQGRPA